MQRSGRRAWLPIVLGAIAVSILAMIVAAPRLIGSLLEDQLRAGPGDDGLSSEVDRVAFAWPARLHLEGFRLRLAVGAEPAVTVRSVDVSAAPLRWLLGDEFLHVTLAGPRVVLTRRPDGTFDLVDRLWSVGAPAPDQRAPDGGVMHRAPEDATDPEPDLAVSELDAGDPDDAAPVDRMAMDGARWTRIDDPFTVVHGTFTISDGALLIVDPAVGTSTELRDVTLSARVQTDEVISVDVSARQRGREEREGAITARARVAFSSGIRFWYDAIEVLRRLELDVHARVAPCTVGDVDLGGELRAAVHAGHALLRADGSLNRGRAAVHVETRAVPGSRAVAGATHVALRDVGLIPAFAPLLVQLNPIFDVGNGTLAGRLDAAWQGTWSASPGGRQRSQMHGRLRVEDLAVSGAPLATTILAVLGESGRPLAGDLRAQNIRSENGRIAYDRMVLTGRDPMLTFAGTIAEDGRLRLMCEAASLTPRRIPIVGWLDDPRVQGAVEPTTLFQPPARGGGAGRTWSCESCDRRPT